MVQMFSEWQVCLSVPLLLTSFFTFCCETCDVSTLVGMTMHNIFIILMITFELAAFYH